MKLIIENRTFEFKSEKRRTLELIEATELKRKYTNKLERKAS